MKIINPPKMRLRSLSVLAYANGFTLWHYRTEYDLHVMQSDGFFDEATAMLNRGDIVMVSAKDGAGTLFVSAAGSGAVRVQPAGWVSA
jgi:hypothetical protein